MRTITIKDIYNDVSYINPSVSTISSIGEFIEESSRQVALSVRSRIAKLARNKENSQEVLDFVKSNTKLLKDYYAFVKSNKKYSKEFYSKRFTFESAREFLNC